MLINLAQHIGLNIHEAYLDLEKTDNSFKLLVIERGTGGCTFPSMEILAEGSFTDEDSIIKLFVSESFIEQVLDAKTKIQQDNPYFYETVFK